MRGNSRQADSTRDILLSTVKSAGFWSAIVAIVGAISLVGGGILYLTIAELENFAVSVLVIGLALLLLALILSPRAAALFLVGRRGRYGSNVLVMTLAFFIIAILVNFLLFRNPTRVDTTATQVFTLAPQTINILEDLDTTVRANAFFTPSSAATAAARQQAEDLLNEFERYSGNFVVRFIDPEVSRALAEQYDVTSYPAVVFEDVNRGVQEHVTALTEQGFVTGILIATGVERKVVYYLTGHQEAAITRDPGTDQVEETGFDFALQGMQRDNYVVLPLNLTQFEVVPDNAAVLVIAGPRSDLNDVERDALIDYILGGGRVVALFDPATPQSYLELLSLWGLTLGDHNVADALSNVAGQDFTPLAQQANSQYVPPSLAGDISIADQIDVTFFPGVTSINAIMNPADFPPHVQIVPLVLSTPVSWLETNPEKAEFDPAEDVRGPFNLAAVIRGRATVAHDPQAALGFPELKLVVFGDSDFARNKYFYSSDNQDLLLNSVNWLAEDYDLISIRPKLIPIRELVLNKREREFVKWSSWFLPPAIMLLAGGYVWWRRR